eukprot:8407_1
MSTVYRSQETEKRWKQQYGLDLDALRNMSVADAKKWWDDTKCMSTFGGLGRKVCSVNPTHNYVPYAMRKNCRRRHCNGKLSLELHDKKDKDKYAAYHAILCYIRNKKTHSAKTPADIQTKNKTNRDRYHSNIEESRAKQRIKNRKYSPKKSGSKRPRINLIQYMITQFIMNMFKNLMDFKNLDASVIIFLKNEYTILLGSKHEYDMRWDLVLKWCRYEGKIEKKMICKNEFDHVLQIKRDVFRCIIVIIQFFAALIFAPTSIDFDSLDIIRINPHNVSSIIASDENEKDEKENENDKKEKEKDETENKDAIYERKPTGEYAPLYKFYSNVYKSNLYDLDTLYKDPKILINSVQEPCEQIIKDIANEFFPFVGKNAFGLCKQKK